MTIATPILDPTTPVPVTLQAQQWNTVLAVLSDQPYRLSAPLIEAITTQANAVAVAAAGAPNLANGSDHVSDR
jgi:hypothetical protein